MKNNPKILIVRLSAIGDVVHSLPVAYALRKKFPDAYIAWAVEDRSSDILINNPLIDKVFVFPKSKWKKRGLSFKNLKEFLSLIQEIKKEKFDIAIDVQELFKSGIITFLSGAKRRIAHKGTREFADIFVNEKLPAHNIFDPERLVIERNLEPAKYLGAPVDEVKFALPPVSEETKQKIDDLFSNQGGSRHLTYVNNQCFEVVEQNLKHQLTEYHYPNLSQNKELIVFSPATIWPSKHWREEYWAKLLDNLAEKYNVVFTGTTKDNELIQRITSKANTDNYYNIAGKTSLLELIEVFNRSKYVIAPDTGPAHIANATEKPSIIMIFGSTGVRRNPPIGEQHSALAVNLPCQPCFKRNCPRKDIPMECMKKLTPEMVLEKIN